MYVDNGWEGAVRGNSDSIYDQKIEGFALSVSEVRAMARRQLTGSTIAGILVVAVAAVVGLRSAEHSASPRYATAHNGVQQPTFVAPPDHILAASKLKIDAP
jgi:hypothetical protein